MTPANLSTAQGLAATCLTANAAFAGVPLFLELAEGATPDELAALLKQFENALATVGVAAVILSPELASLDEVKAGAVHADLAVTIALVENPEVNRAAADASIVPARTPAGKSLRVLLEAAVAALLPAEFRFPHQLAGRVEWADGYWASYLVAHKRHIIRAAS